MPGLIGIKKVGKSLTHNLQEGMQLMSYGKTQTYDQIYEDHFLTASRVHLKKIGEKSSPFVFKGNYCWLDGEIYNLQEVANKYRLEITSFPELLIAAYLDKNLFEQILSEIDGYFSAVIYDKENFKIAIISDRYGLKPLYIWNQGNKFGWASEMKAFLAIPDFDISIRNGALDCFMTIGHMMGNITWFDNVELMEPSTILTYSLTESNIIDKHKYWSWSCIKPQIISFEEAASSMGDMIVDAVRRRWDKSSRFGISLSGGLDSRAILASLEDTSDIVAYTFGKKNCLDIEIASRVSKLKGVKHIIKEINADNWFDNRSLGIWKTDGMLNLLHMHDTAVSNAFSELVDINLSGFLGDALEGGLHLHGKAYNCRINQDIATRLYKDFSKYSPFDDNYFDIEHVDVYVFNNLNRRFTNLGITLDSRTVEQRLPFLDNRLIEFVYSLPDDYRINSKLYNASLLKRLPTFYENIPWQRTGIPISKKQNRYLRFISRKADKFFDKIGINQDLTDYFDYNKWFKEINIYHVFTKILDPKYAIYQNYTDQNYITKYLTPHFKGTKDYSRELGLALTTEIWFQQIFNKTNRLS